MFKKYGIWLLIAIFSLWYSIFSIIRHLRLESYMFDLGYYDQTIWLFAHGKGLYSSIIEGHPWGDHVSLTILLLAPLYWLWDNTLALLIFQSVFVCLGALPIYLLSQKKLKNSISLSGHKPKIHITLRCTPIIRFFIELI